MTHIDYLILIKKRATIVFDNIFFSWIVSISILLFFFWDEQHKYAPYTINRHHKANQWDVQIQNYVLILHTKIKIYFSCCLFNLLQKIIHFEWNDWALFFFNETKLKKWRNKIAIVNCKHKKKKNCIHLTFSRRISIKLKLPFSLFIC